MGGGDSPEQHPDRLSGAAARFGKLVALAKAKPGELKYEMPGVRSDVSALMEQVKRATGINMIGVPYKSRGADMTDAVAGQVAITFNFWAS